ncbi:MAG: hypothetical protein QHH10_04935 [Peptococcaceae bacterium]|jgi:hypothetical protein|nr:hypothetical protein [Peptococcaceae bacterium]MDH7524644.1 hypothetical protein [Peptococcaceae bacterium]
MIKLIIERLMGADKLEKQVVKASSGLIGAYGFCSYFSLTGCRQNAQDKQQS